MTEPAKKKVAKKKASRRPAQASNLGNKKPEPAKEVVEKIIDKIEVKDVKSYGLSNKFILINVGDDKRPANDNDIQQVQSEITKLFKENNIEDCLVYVTHHAVKITVVE